MSRKQIMLAAFCAAALTGALPAWADSIQLTGTVRDFKRGDQTGGHVDFETCATVSGHGQYGLVNGLVSMDLSEDNKPVYNSTRPSNDSMSGSANFNQWFRDAQNINLSTPVAITLSNGLSTPGGVYSYATTKFFPIDGQLFGNQGQKDASNNIHNFSFTYEIGTEFSYRPNQNFSFTGDDDVWVYIDGKKVIDLGGVHAAANGSVRLFAGKAFVTNAHFNTGGDIKQLTQADVDATTVAWTNMGMTGTMPFHAGDKYIELHLNNDLPDVITNFHSAAVDVGSYATLQRIGLKFSDNTTQWFEAPGGYRGTFAGTGAYANKPVVGVWVKVGPDNAALQYYGADGSGGISHSLHFFFAERHVTESNFRIDTSITLHPSALSTISPLYD